MFWHAHTHTRTHLVYVRPLRGPSAPAQSRGSRLRHGLPGKVSQDVAEERYVSINVAVPDKGRRRLAATVRAAAKARSADQRNTNAAVPTARCAGGAALALLWARSLTNSAAGAPALTNLNAKLWVCPSFSTFSDMQSCPRSAATVSARPASCSEWRHQ